jgi:hypothetical protein
MLQGKVPKLLVVAIRGVPERGTCCTPQHCSATHSTSGWVSAVAQGPHLATAAHSQHITPMHMQQSPHAMQHCNT